MTVRRKGTMCQLRSMAGLAKPGWSSFPPGCLVWVPRRATVLDPVGRQLTRSLGRPRNGQLVVGGDHLSLRHPFRQDPGTWNTNTD